MREDHCLFQWKKICDDLGIKTFLMIGTALGFHRDGSYCKDDFDLDVGVKCTKQKVVELFNTLEENGFQRDTNWQNQGWELNCHFYKYGILLNIHYQFLKDEEPFFKKMDTVTYKGNKFNLPTPIDEYLLLNYGKDWKIPAPVRSRPLVGKRKEFNGGPEKSTGFNWDGYLASKKERYEGVI